MASFDLLVDTDPMAAQIDTVNGSVRNVTLAVSAMQAAVIAQEEESSRQICANVDNGFYILMKSQLSQKIAACSSVMSGKLLLMKKFRADINHIKEIMQDDYNRICRRYRKQFTALNKALEVRIHELDRPAMEIARLEKNYFDTQRDESSTVICTGQDTQMTAVISVNANLKNKTVKALQVMAENVNSSAVYNRKIMHIMNNKTVEAKTDRFIPVVVFESESMFDAQTSVQNIYSAQSGNTKKDELLTGAVQQQTAAFEWEAGHLEERESIRNYFMQQVTGSGCDERIAQEMIRLFGESSWAVPISREAANEL